MSGENSGARSQRLNQVIADYLAAVESDMAPDRDELLEQHPDMVEDLTSFLADHDQMQAAVDPPTLPPTHTDVEAATLARRVPPLESPTAPPGQRNTQVDAATLPPDGSTRDAPPVGTKIRYFGDYELIDEIARGGMGVVYKARQASLNRTVALKMILAGQLASEEDVQRFYAEAEAAANLDHPGIVPIYEVGEHEGQHYFSMGFVEGSSLSAKVADGPLPPGEAAEYTRKVAEAVTFAHGRGVIHRDLKPANVLLDANDEPKVTDFGLAKKVEGDSGLTATGQILGTPGYMPPEQAAGKIDEVKDTADVYSVGAILYHLLTGRPPFQADNPVDTLMQVLGEEPVSPRQLNPKVPRDLETICLKCLQKEPRRRYSAARALVEDLDRHVHNKPIHARPIGFGERVLKWAKRRPAIASLLVVAIFGFAGVMWQWWRANYQWRRAEQLLVESQTSLYLSQIYLADRERLDGHLDQMAEVLDTCTPALRGWEWHYLKRQGRAEILSISCGTSLFALAVRPTGEQIAVSGSAEHGYGVSLFDAQSGEKVTRLDGHKYPVRALAWSPDGKWLVAGGGSWQGQEGEVRIWDPDSQQQVLSFHAHGDLVTAVAFHPDGDKLVSADRSGVVKLWNVPAGEELLSLGAGAGQIKGLAINPQGTQLAVATAGSRSFHGAATLWDLNTGQKRTALRGTSSAVWDIAFSRDGRLVAAGDLSDQVTVWDAATGEVIHTLHDAGRKVAFSPNGKHLATADASTPKQAKATRIWDLSEGRLVRTYYGSFNCLAYSPDSRHIVTASFNNTIKIWDATQDPESAKLAIATAFDPHALSFSPDGRQIVVGDDSTDFTEKDESGSRSFNRKTITLWQAATREKAWHAVSEDENHAIRDVAFGPDGRWFATVQSWNGRETDPTCKVSLWEAKNGKPTWKIERPPTHRLWSLAVSPNGQRIAFGGRVQTVEICDTKTGQQLLTIPIEARCLAFSPDGQWLAVPSSGPMEEVKLFEVSTGKERRSYVVDLSTRKKRDNELPEGGSINDLAFSPDGRYLAAAYGSYTRDDAVAIWDVSSGRVRATLVGHSDDVTCVDFSPDGTRLVSGGKDEAIIVWHVELSRAVLNLPSHLHEIYDLAFGPDGNRIAALGQGGLRIWEATPVEFPDGHSSAAEPAGSDRITGIHR